MSKTIHTLDITPLPHLIVSQTKTDISYPEAISEFVDNSLDAGANLISIEIKPDSLTIKDNGRGCGDLRDMLTLGAHRKSEKTKLGRYGVGAKNAACGLGGVLRIASVQDRILRTAEIDWNALEQWNRVSATEEDTNQDNGTIVSVWQLYRTRCEHQRVIDRVSYNFAPAIWAGKHILINDQPCSGWTIPDLSNAITGEAEYSDELSFRVRAGIVDRNTRDPFIISYEHRIICGTCEPCIAYRPSSKFLAFVELFGKWPLLKHKDGVKDSPEAAWLYSELHDICEPLLRQIQQQSESVELEKMSSEFEDAILEAMGTAKRPNRNGSKREDSEKETDRVVREAKIVDGPGAVKQRGRTGSRRGFDLSFDAFEGNQIGRIDVNAKRVSVRLNQNHPTIQRFSKDRVDRLALYSIAAALLCNHQTTEGSLQKVLALELGDSPQEKFSIGLGDILAFLHSKFAASSEAA